MEEMTMIITVSEYEALHHQVTLLTEKVKELEAVNVALIAENAELKAKLNKDSKNSNKPPSSDGLKKNSIKNGRVKGEKPSGGQIGHEGVTKTQTTTPNNIVELKPASTCDCGGKIQTHPEGYVSRQVTDIVPLRTETTEYRSFSGICEHCGKIHTGGFPKDVKGSVSYGNNLNATAAYLHLYQLIPLKRTTELFADLFGIKMSQGTVLSAVKECSDKLEGTEAQIKEAIIGSEVVHFDESGMRVNGETHWLHSAGTDKLTVYTIHKKRGREAMDEMGILPKFKGTAVHDHWKSYYHYECAHAECNQHHLRSLKYLHENLGQAWAEDMAALLMRIKKHVDLSKSFGADSISQDDIDDYTQIYRNILENANDDKKPIESIRMINRLLKYEQETLLFMLDFSVPFTNNLAERDIRMPKVKQKISGSFRSDEGAESFARTRGFISTVKKNGKKVIDGLKATLSGENFLFGNGIILSTNGSKT